MIRFGRTLLACSPFLALTYAPVLWLLVDSLQGDRFPHFERWAGVFSDPYRWGLFLNTAKVMAGVVAVTTLVGVPLGFLLGRTNLYGRRWHGAILALPLFVPPFIAGIAWTELTAIPLGGYPAIILLLSSALFGIVALATALSLRAVGAELEEVACLHLGRAAVLRRIAMPLARQQILFAALLVGVFSIGDFSVPDFFSFAGVRQGSFQVLSTDIWYRWNSQESFEATSATVPVLAMTVLIALLMAWLARSRDTASIRSAHRSPPVIELGRAQWPAQAFVVSVAIITLWVPVGVMVRWILRRPPAASADSESVTAVLRHAVESGGPDLLNSALLSAAGALLAIAVAWVPARILARVRGGVLAYAFTLLPLAMPGLFLGMAGIRIFRGSAAMQDFAASSGLVVAVLGARFAPLAALVLAAYLRRIDRTVLESATLMVGGTARRFLTGPLALPSVAAVFLLCFALGLRELDPVIMLEAAQRTMTLRVFNQVHWAAYLRRIDRTVLEPATQMVGGTARRFLRVTGPLALPGVAAVFLLCFALGLRELDAVVMLEGAQRTMTLRIFNQVHYARDRLVAGWSLLQLGAVFLPLFVALTIGLRLPGSPLPDDRR